MLLTELDPQPSRENNSISMSTTLHRCTELTRFEVELNLNYFLPRRILFRVPLTCIDSSLRLRLLSLPLISIRLVAIISLNDATIRLERRRNGKNKNWKNRVRGKYHVSLYTWNIITRAESKNNPGVRATCGNILQHL